VLMYRYKYDTVPLFQTFLMLIDLAEKVLCF